MATVRNVTYNNINVDNCGYAAQIQSCYGSDDAASCAASPSTSSITDVHFNEFTGKTSGKVYDSPRVYLQPCLPEYRLLPVSTALRLGHATSTLATSKPRRDRGRHNTYVRTLTTKTTAFRVLVQRVGEHEYVVSINRFNQNVIDGNQCATHCRSSRRTPN